MKKYVHDLRVAAVETPRKGYVLLKLSLPSGTMPEMLPGQFVEVQVPHSPQTFLRRPISINFVDEACHELWLLVHVVGEGTRALSQLQPGDTLMGMDLAHGGHLSHGSPVNISGKYFNVLHYGVSKETGLIDYDEVERIAAEHHPKLIITGASAYPRIIDFARFREICDRCGAFFMVDMAHIAGLVAAGLHPSPVPYADVVTSTTHKTLRGPRGGLILCREQYAKQIDKAIFPGTQGGPLEHIIAAKAVAFGEAMTEDFINYQKQIIKNAKAFENALKREGFELVSDGTDNHLILIDLRWTGITGRELEKRLDEVHITVNKNAIPFDPEKPTITSGIRVGTPAVTSRGFNEADMVLVAHLIRLAATDFEANREYIVSEAGRLCAAHPIYD